MTIAVIAFPAQAQDAAPAADWDLRQDAQAGAVIAFSAFDNGLTVAVRCVNHTLTAVVTGLPPESGDTRKLRLRFADDADDYEETWNVAGTAGNALSSFPARFARNLRTGGRLDLVVPGGAEGGRNLRYVLNLPASNSAIDETLTACDKPLADPRDIEIDKINADSLPGGVVWSRAPRGEYPANRYGRGFAVLSCLTNPDGSLRDCVVESEHPQDGGFGREALRGTRHARLRNEEGAPTPVPPRFLAFRVNFALQENRYQRHF